MRLLGLDVGSKTIGVAVSDPLGITAQAVMTIPIDEDRHNFGMRSLKKLVREYDADGFVLGLPKNMDGTAGRSVSRQAGSNAMPASVVLEMTKRISGCSANCRNASKSAYGLSPRLITSISR